MKKASLDSSGHIADPGVKQVRDYLVYGLSLPERTLRSTAAMLGGVVSGSASLLVPQAFRDSKSYQTFVQQMLDLLVEDVGGVAVSTTDSESAGIENYVARKTVGSFIDLAGMATLHLSPVVVLALVSDIAYGSKTYLNELGEQLKQEGVIAQDSTIDNATDLLSAISEFSGETAASFDTPPISIEGLKHTIEETTDNLARLDPATVLPKSEIDRFWSDLHSITEKQDVGLIQLSSALTMYAMDQMEMASKGALTTITVTGAMLDRHVLNHYWDGLEEISKRGIYTIVAESSGPYIEAVWNNFATGRKTITEDLVSGKLAGKIWDGIYGWFENDAPDNPDSDQ